MTKTKIGLSYKKTGVNVLGRLLLLALLALALLLGLDAISPSVSHASHGGEVVLIQSAGLRRGGAASGRRLHAGLFDNHHNFGATPIRSYMEIAEIHGSDLCDDNTGLLSNDTLSAINEEVNMAFPAGKTNWSFSLGGNFERGDRICIAAAGVDPTTGRASSSNPNKHYKIYELRVLDDLPTNLQPLAQVITTLDNGGGGSAPTAVVHDTSAVDSGPKTRPNDSDFKIFDSFPRRERTRWSSVSTDPNGYPWPGEANIPGGYETLTAGSFNQVVNWPADPVVYPIDWESLSLMIADNHADCTDSVEPLGGLGHHAGGVCDTEIELDLLVPSGTGSVGIWAQDLCINGWDHVNVGIKDIKTEILIKGKNNKEEIVGVNNHFTNRDSSDGRPPAWDCFDDAIHYNPGGGEESPIDSSTGTYRMPGGTSSSPTASEYQVSVLGGTASYQRTVTHDNVTMTLPALGYHVDELFVYGGLGKTTGIEPLEQIELQTENESGNRFLSNSDSHLYDLYKIIVRFDDDSKTGNGFYNIFSLSAIAAEDDVGKKIILDYPSANKLENNETLSHITVSNSLYYSNAWQAEYSQSQLGFRPTWDYELELALPCDIFTDEFWGGTNSDGTKLDGTESLFLDVYNKLLGPNLDGNDFDDLFNVDEKYVMVPIGIYDSDIDWPGYNLQNDGQPGGTGRNLLSVKYRDKFNDSAGWGSANSAVDIDENAINNLPYMGVDRNIDNSERGFTEAHNASSNETEAIWVKFQGLDNYFQLQFSNFHHMNYTQIVLPFSQRHKFEKCPQQEFEVEFTEDCELRVVSLDWSHPNYPSNSYPEVDIDIGYENGATWLSIIDPDPTKAKLKIENNISKAGGDGDLLSLLKFQDSTEPVTWHSLIKDGDLPTNDPGQEYQVRLVGYYNGSQLKKLDDPLNPLDAVIATGHTPFNFEANDTLGKYRFKDAASPEVWSSVAPNDKSCLQPEFEIDVTDTCDVRIVKLVWDHPKMDPDPQARVTWFDPTAPPGSRYRHSHGRIDQPHEMTNPTDPESEIHLLGNFEDYLVDSTKHPHKISANKSLDDGDLVVNQDYQVRLTGFYDSPPPAAVVSLHSVIGPAQGAVGGVVRILEPSPGKYRLKVSTTYDSGVWVDWREYPDDPIGRCGDDTQDLEVIIDQDCNLVIEKMSWIRSNSSKPESLEFEIGKGDPMDSSWGPLISHKANQLNPSGDDRDLLQFISNDTTITTTTTLINGGQISPVTVPTNSSPLLTTAMVGYYTNGSSPLQNLPHAGDSIEVTTGSGAGYVVVSEGGSPTKYSLHSRELIPGGGFRWVRFPTAPTEYCSETLDADFVIEITNACDIRITQLDWDMNSNDLHVSLGYEDSVGNWQEVPGARERFAQTTAPQWFTGFVTRHNPNIETLYQMLEHTRELAINKTYELRITGYYNGSNLVHLGQDDQITADRFPGGQGIFYIVPITPGAYRFYADSDIFPPEPAPPATPFGCLPGPSRPVLEIDIRSGPTSPCDIFATILRWNPGDDEVHPLRVSINQGGVNEFSQGTDQILPGNPDRLVLPFGNTPGAQPYNGILGVGGTYQLILDGYYDNNNSGQFTQFPVPPLLSLAYIASGESQFAIHQHIDPLISTDPLYYLMVGSTRVPNSGWCNLPDPPPITPDCAVRNSAFWQGPGTRVNLDKYLQGNHIWTDSSGALPSPAVPIPSERYNNYVSPYQNVPPPKSPGQIAYHQDPSVNYIPDAANNPLAPIPGSGHTRESIRNDLLAAFEYNWNDRDQRRRDSVWELFGERYQPETTIRWLSGPGSYGGSGFGSGWANSYNPVRITPTTLYTGFSPTPSITAIPKHRPGTSYPTGLGFDPRQVSNPSTSQYLEFETDNPYEYHTFGNNQTENIVPYRWIFYWDVSVTHTHRWMWFHEYDAEFAWDWGGNYGHYSATHTHHSPGCTTCTPPYPPSSYSHKDAIVDGYHFQADSQGPGAIPGEWNAVGTIRTTRWIWTRQTNVPTITRKSRVTGDLENCSWVLIVRPPVCRVTRRRPFATGESRLNPSNPDIHDRNPFYEIFPAGGPTNFSKLEARNYNEFFLSSTSQTGATLRPSAGVWFPRTNTGAGVPNLTAAPISSPWMTKRPDGSAAAIPTIYEARNMIPEWPGEYRLNWDIGWNAHARYQWPDSDPDNVSPGRGSTNAWQGGQPTNQRLTCTDPLDGIHVYVSAKPPVCRVKHTIFEFTDPELRLQIGLKNYNWVDLLVRGPNELVPVRSVRTPQTYEAVRITTGNVYGGDVERRVTSIPALEPPPWTLNNPGHPITTGGAWVDLESDNSLATIPAPLGRYRFSWDLWVQRGIEWWSTADSGKYPNAWWDGNNNDERIRQKSINDQPGKECEEILQVIRIPFVKTFIGGMSAGGRFGLGDEFNSCKGDDWIPHPTTNQGAWGHSADTTTLNDAVGSSVEHALRVQSSVGGIYSSSLTEQPDSHTKPNNIQSKALTFANDTTNPAFGGKFSNQVNPSWRCLPNYWRIPDNANLRDPDTNTPIPGLTNFVDPLDPQKGARNSRLGTGSGVDIKDGDVIYIEGDLEITGDIRETGEEDLRTSIFVKGDVTISGNILNNTSSQKYFGFSDLGLIQIIALGDIHVQPQVTQIDATLVAYPVYSGGIITGGGSIDLCASGTDDLLDHYKLCASDDTVVPRVNHQLRINGALVAQRVYFNRLHETLKNRDPTLPAYPYGREPTWATYGNTRASEVIVLMPEYHFVTPAASVFDDWIKRPQAIFDIPTSL